MLKKKLSSLIILAILVLFSLPIKLNAEEVTIPAKTALIKELLEITEVKKMSENIVNTMLLQMDSSYPQMFSQMIKEAGVPENKREELQNNFNESRLRFSQRFRELFPQRLNLGQTLEEIYYPLYDKYFTVDELKDLIAFYKSSTGDKFIKIAPALMQEAMQKSSELLNPNIIQLVNEILREEKDRLLKIKSSSQAGKQN